MGQVTAPVRLILFERCFYSLLGRKTEPLLSQIDGRPLAGGASQLHAKRSVSSTDGAAVVNHTQLLYICVQKEGISTTLHYRLCL